MSAVLYKVCGRTAWLAAQASGVLEPSAVDQRDGFVHLSAASQVAGTLAKHFAGQEDLVLLSVALERLPAASLRWEVSRGSEKFPHLYGELRVDSVIRVDALALTPSGVHALPRLE
jgi:uncharacterized protein (DUF952 family)